MGAIQIGNLTYNYQPDGDDVHQGPDGSGEATLTYKTTATGFTLSSLPSPLSAHPTYSALKLYEAQAKREEGDFMAVTCTYRGVIASNPLIYMQEEFTLSDSAEPIETFYKFNYPYDNPPVNANELGAIHRALDSRVEYNVAFYPNATAVGILLWKKMRRGIDSYLAIGGVYRQTYISANIPSSLSGLGFIALPNPSPPGVPIQFNFLWSGLSWRKTGGVVTITKDFKLSRYGGWDGDLYTLPA